MRLTTFTDRLDRLLRVRAFKDASHNGLQLANRGDVTRVLTGVDASLRLLREAEARGADCVVCHHGISWGDSLARITELNHALVSFALSRNIAIYAAHLPLDAHPRIGNNALLCRALGLARPRPAFSYHGETIGYVGSFPRPLSRDAVLARVRQAVSSDLRSLDFGAVRIRTVGVVSGGAADMADQAAALGADLYLTGEASLQGYNLAENLGLNVVFAGHYATETFGVRALADHVSQRLGLPAEFADFQIPY